jgi:hypothetical protein
MTSVILKSVLVAVRCTSVQFTAGGSVADEIRYHLYSMPYGLYLSLAKREFVNCCALLAESHITTAIRAPFVAYDQTLMWCLDFNVVQSSSSQSDSERVLHSQPQI